MKGIFSILTVLIILSACKKDTVQNGNSNPPPTPPALDSNYIDTLYKTITRGGITDTVLYFKYNYDALKRVTSIKWEINDFGLPVNGDATETYFYNNTDTLPYKSIRNIHYSTLHDTLIFFHSFDNSARMIKDSVLNFYRGIGPMGSNYFIRTHIFNFQYNNNLIVKTETSIPIYDPTNNFTYTMSDSIITSSGNVLTSVHYNGILKAYSNTRTYDNLPNPHDKLNIVKTFLVVSHLSQPEFYTFFSGKNNYTSYSSTVFLPPPAVTRSNTYTNTYLPSGYLVKAVTPSSSTPGDIDTWIYKYKAL